MSDQPFRLPVGGHLDRNHIVQFQFDGRRYAGFAGDTLASALIANGVHLVGRSFKYHRPRGIMSAGSDEPNALVAIGRGGRYTPNLRATQVEIFEGLVAESQNRWPSLFFDAGAINDVLHPLIPAGFYYKTFMWPRRGWARFYEPLIRRSAGLGRAPSAGDLDRYTQVYQHCDVLVIGAGPAGLAAARAAAEAGANVILCDEQAMAGGTLLAERTSTIDGKSADSWREEMIAAIAAARNARLLLRATAFGWYPHNFIAVCERVTDHQAHPSTTMPRERLWQVRAREVVLATGSIERPLVFPGNDRPGIMLADAARVYANRYAARPGTNAVVFTNNDNGYRSALELQAAGVAIHRIVDARREPRGDWLQRAIAEKLCISPGAAVIRTHGRRRLSRVTIAKIDRAGAASAAVEIACDLLLMSGGFTPAVHLFSQSRGRLSFDEGLQAFLPGQSAECERSAGACRGVYDLKDVVADGAAAGREAAVAAGCAVPSVQSPRPVATAVSPVDQEPPFRSVRGRAWVDFQNDVTEKDVRLAVQEGFRSIEHVKRYTTSGMATDQGKTSNMNTLDIVSGALEKKIPDVGHTTFRPPYTPVSFGVLAGQSRGDLFDPVRTTPIHTWAVEQGAVFEEVGLWKRARYFPRDGESIQAAVARECRATRESVGIFDGSTLGKIEVVGPDACEFMNRIYTNSWSRLEPGRLRYGLMLREDGFVLDDGVVARLAPNRFHVTTTTGGASRVLHHMEDYLQTEWPDLRVWLTSTTEHWAVIAVQGPKARKVIAPLVEGIDVSAAAMPHMSYREGRVAGVRARLFRVSFTGELGFEINVPSSCALNVWLEVFAAGEPFGLTPYGTEAMHVLRAEKGYVIVGQETDGTITPDDLGMGWMIGKSKADFVGKRSLDRPAFRRTDRKQLVGLLNMENDMALEEGAQVVERPGAERPLPMLGHVTSAYWSAVLKRPIALALLAAGRQRKGQTLFAVAGDRITEVQVCDPTFIDPEGSRLHA